MRRGLAIVIIGVTVAVGTLTAQSNEKPSEEFSKAMRDAGEAARALRAASKEFEESGAGAQDFDPFEAAAVSMTGTFTTARTYFQAKQAAGAVALSERALEHAAALQAAAKERDYRLVLEASTALNTACGACHQAHRVQTPEGYEIKLQ